MASVGAVRSWFGWWATLLGLYLLLAAKLTGEEILVGAGAAALAATAATVTAKAGNLRFQPRLSWLRRFARLPGLVLVDCAIVGAALWRRVILRRTVEGVFRSVPFDAGGDDAVSAARRALVTAGISLAPNTYLVDMDRERGILLVHQLVPSTETPGKSDREWPL